MGGTLSRFGTGLSPELGLFLVLRWGARQRWCRISVAKARDSVRQASGRLCPELIVSREKPLQRLIQPRRTSCKAWRRPNSSLLHCPLETFSSSLTSPSTPCRPFTYSERAAPLFSDIRIYGRNNRIPAFRRTLVRRRLDLCIILVQRHCWRLAT